MKKFTLLICFLLASVQGFLHAQMFSGRGNTGMNSTADTSQKEQVKTNDSIAIYYTFYRDSTRFKVNPSVHNENQIPYLSIWHRDLGNFGTAYSSLLFQPVLQTGRELGMQNKLAYLTEQRTCRFYNTTRPYTDIYYSMGTKQEQMISLLHTQNIRPDWNIALAYTKLVSPGQFKLIRSNHDQAMMNSWYRSPNQRYELKAALLYNKLQQDENGGVQDESLLANPSYYDRRLIPVLFSVSSFSRNRSSVLNFYRQASFQWWHSYNFGRRSSDSTKGSAFKLKHRFYTDLIYQYFKDQQPDSSYYNYVYSGIQANADSLYDKHDLNRYGQLLSLQKEISIGKSYAQMEAGYGIETDVIFNQRNKSSYLNQYVFAELLKLKEASKPWRYQANMKFYFSGNAAANLELHATAGRSLPGLLGDIQFGFDQCIQSASYKYSYFREMNSGTIPLKKTLINKLSSTYSCPKVKFSISVHQYTIAQYMYVDTNWMVQQYATSIRVEQLQVKKTFTWRKINLENEIILQALNAQAPLHLPQFLNHHQLYFSDSVFKRKLAIETGVGVTYNSPFKNDVYIPVFQSFAPQYNRTVNNIPMMSAFFNFGLRKFKAAIAFDEIQQLYADNNLNYPSYPRTNIMMRLRLNWVLIN